MRTGIDKGLFMYYIIHFVVIYSNILKYSSTFDMATALHDFIVFFNIFLIKVSYLFTFLVKILFNIFLRSNLKQKKQLLINCFYTLTKVTVLAILISEHELMIHFELAVYYLHTY